jgi:transcriptional regulator with XRE-family HTH domain
MAQRFSQRLNALFESAPNHVTNAMVVRSMTEDGCRISTPYLSQLRTGVRTNPSPEVVAALARFFEVTPDYFFNP